MVGSEIALMTDGQPISTRFQRGERMTIASLTTNNQPVMNALLALSCLKLERVFYIFTDIVFLDQKRMVTSLHLSTKRKWNAAPTIQKAVNRWYLLSVGKRKNRCG